MTTTASAEAGGLRLDLDGQQTLVSWRWVLDHCEDPASFNAETRQRRVNVLGDEAIGAPQGIDVRRDRIALRWPGENERWLAISTVAALLSPEPAASSTSPALWGDASQVALQVHEVADVLADDEALRGWVQDLQVYGVGKLSGFSGDTDDVDTLVQRIGYPRSTIFGSVWRLASDETAHDDTAYTQEFLGPHTDGTYSHDAPGLQIFCCVERSGTGGESILVDGFAIADELRRDHPEDFETLATIDVPAHYIESGVELRAARPVLRRGSDGEVVQVSYNNYDRSPMLLSPPELMDAFYAAYGRFDQLVNDPQRRLTIGLEPGDVLAMDNWRVLHGRNAYSGPRTFIGCYLNHEDFESRCRILGLD